MSRARVRDSKLKHIFYGLCIVSILHTPNIDIKRYTYLRYIKRYYQIHTAQLTCLVDSFYIVYLFTRKTFFIIWRFTSLPKMFRTCMTFRFWLKRKTYWSLVYKSTICPLRGFMSLVYAFIFTHISKKVYMRLIKVVIHVW